MVREQDSIFDSRNALPFATEGIKDGVTSGRVEESEGWRGGEVGPKRRRIDREPIRGQEEKEDKEGKAYD